MLTTTTAGRSRSSARKAPSSPRRVSSASGHASGPSPPSSTYRSSAVRSTCARNRCPRPAPSLAPSMSPGMSAMTAVPSPRYSTPRLGSMVVNGYAAILGCARVSAASSEDLPALGSPTRPMSASSLRESVSQSSSPSRPFSANLGAWRVELLKQTLPRPPSPPRATTRRWPSRTRSPRRSPSASRTSVPTGTWTSSSGPSAPRLFAPRPWPPLTARKWCLWRKCERSCSWRVATSTTSPPGAPSPPSGPPLGMYFSRRKLMEPLPP